MSIQAIFLNKINNFSAKNINCTGYLMMNNYLVINWYCIIHLKIIKIYKVIWSDILG